MASDKGQNKMTRTITIEDATNRLREIIETLDPNDELTILADGQPIAKHRRQERQSWPCQPGSAQNTPHWMAPDFDAPLDDFKEYIK